MGIIINYINRSDEMIFKVLYQESIHEIPVREHTKCLYLEAKSIRDVRQKLADREYNIELIQELDKAHLEYEQKSDNFELENV